jgi:hypothetical protein
MRTFLTVLFLFVAFITHSQQSCFKVAQHYYRSNPFEKPFSTFVNHLLNDPTLKNTTQSKKTDTTLYFLTGTYSTHSPFFFKSTHSKITLAEREEIMKSDTTVYVQPVFNYQLICYAAPGENGKKDVQEEFEKFCKKYKKGFSKTTSKNIDDGNGKSGEIRDFSIIYLTYPVLTAAWVSSADLKENFFAITLTFRVSDNMAYLPVPAYGF